MEPRMVQASPGSGHREMHNARYARHVLRLTVLPVHFLVVSRYVLLTKLIQMPAGLTLIRNPGIRIRSHKKSNP